MNPWWTSAAIGAAGIGASVWAVRGKASSIFGESVYRGASEGKSVALTFDDGPSKFTPELLSLLMTHGARATFFMCGANVERWPEIARQVRDQGHEIGSHTFSHPRLDFQSKEFIYLELARAQEAIHAATGISPVWFRAPYGVRWFGLRSAQRRLGLRGAMWTTIARDWRLSTEEVVGRVVKGTEPGAVLCLHDGRGITPNPDIRVTVAAVAEILPQLIRQGYSFRTLSELIPTRAA